MLTFWFTTTNPFSFPSQTLQTNKQKIAIRKPPVLIIIAVWLLPNSVQLGIFTIVNSYNSQLPAIVLGFLEKQDQGSPYHQIKDQGSRIKDQFKIN